MLYIMSLNQLLTMKYRAISYKIAFLMMAIIVIVKQLSKLIWHNDFLLYTASTLLILLIISMTFFLYQDQVKKKIIVTGLFFTVTVFIDILVTIICSLFFHFTVDYMSGLTYGNLIATSMTMIITLLVYIGIAKVSCKHQANELMISYDNEIPVLTAISFLIFLPSIVVSNNVESLKNHMIFIVFLELGIILFVILFCSYRLIKKNLEISNEKYRNQQLEKEMKYYDGITDTSKQLHKLRHDVSNHYQSIQLLLKMQDYEQLQSYLEQINGQIQSANNICLIKDTFLNVLLSELFIRAREQGISMQHKFLLSSYFYKLMENFQEMDKTALFTNLLNNAVRAALQTEEKSVRLSINFSDTIVEIICENTRLNEPLQKKRDGTFKSTKNEAGHGLGMRIIRDTVHKYDGCINYKVTETLFCTTIVFSRKGDRYEEA